MSPSFFKAQKILDIFRKRFTYNQIEFTMFTCTLIKEKRGTQMEDCKKLSPTRWSMKQEIIDDLENYDEVNDDNIREICDGLVPVYNYELIEFCSHYQGEEFWELWLNNEIGGENPIEIIRGNLYSLYVNIGHEVLSEREEDE